MAHDDGTLETAEAEAYEAPRVAPLSLEEGTIFTAAGAPGSLNTV